MTEFKAHCFNEAAHELYSAVCEMSLTHKLGKRLIEARDAFAKASNEILVGPGQHWFHPGTGGTYEVLHIGNVERDRSQVVIYRLSDVSDGLVWTRPLSEFIDGRFQRLT